MSSWLVLLTVCLVLTRYYLLVPYAVVCGRASILLRRIAASCCSWSVAPVRGALLRFVERCSGSRSVAPVVFRIVRRPESRAQCHCLHSILRAPVCARLAPDHCLMHRGQTPPASHQRCGSGRRLWLQMKGEQSNCPAEQPGLRRVVRPKEARRLSVVGGCP